MEGLTRGENTPPKNASAASQESQRVNPPSQNSSQEVQTDTGVPFLNVIYDESELYSSYKERQSATEIEESPSANMIGYIWTMTLSELNITSFGKKENNSANEKIKLMYDDVHKVDMNKTLEPGNMDKRLLLPAIFDSPKSTKIMERCLAPIARLPENILSCIKSMEKAMDNNTIMELQGFQLNSVEEMALHHKTLDIYLNHSVKSTG